jgi:beta-glucanase (GH16 family)
LEVGDSDSGGFPNDLNWVAVDQVTTKAGWDYLAFDFGNPSERFVSNNNMGFSRTTQLQPNVTYDMLSVFFDLGTNKSAAEVYHFDGLEFASTRTIDQPADIAFTEVSPIPAGYELAFEDTFGGDIGVTSAPPVSPESHWIRETGRGPNNDGWGNNESQVYEGDLDNVFVDDGTLQIIARKTGESITSARLKSDLPDLEAYGYIEVRAKMPGESGSGTWPAIWLLGQDAQGVWPDKGEIDIAEGSAAYFTSTQVQAALHFRGDNNPGDPSNPADLAKWTFGNTQVKQATSLSSSIENFHTYQLWWTPESIRIGVDGNANTAYFTYNKPAGATNDKWPYDHPMDMILNLAIGGTLGGTVPAGDFTRKMEVDHVRIYQLPGGGTPTPTPTPSTTVTFEDTSSGYMLTDFGGNAATLADTPPAGASGKAIQVVKGAVGTPSEGWAGTTFLDLASGEFITPTSQTVTMKVWSPTAGTVVRLKLEDKADVTKTVETNATTTVAGGWSDLTFDFTSVASGTNPLNHASSFNKASVFFDFGTAGTGQTYYFDDVGYGAAATPTPTPTPTPSTTVTFEDTSSGYMLTDFGGNAATLADTPPAGASGKAIQVVKGAVGTPSEGWAGTTFLDLASGEFITPTSQTVTMKVWSPTAGTVVRLKLEDKADVTKTVETNATTTVAGGWSDLTFDFTSVASGTNPLNHASSFNKASVFFDFGTAGTGQTYYFDDVGYGAAATPTPTPTPTPSTTVTFEDTSSGYMLTDFGGNAATLADTPPAGASGKAIQVVKGAVGTPSEGWAGTTFLDLASGEFITPTSQTVTMKVWSPTAGTVVRLKLEDKADVTKTVETNATTTVAGGWSDLTFDFTSVASGTNPLNHASSFNKASVFFDFGTAGTGQTYYFDDVGYGAAATPTPTPTPTPSTTVTFEDTTSGYMLVDFGGNVSSVLDTSPAGASDKAIQVIKGAVGTPSEGWAGTTFLELSSGEFITPSSETMTVEVWSPSAGTVVRLKLEDKADPTKTIETDASTSVAGGWQTMTFNLANPATNNGNPTAPLDHASTFNKASLFFDFGNAGSGQAYYFDDVAYNSVI